MLKRRGKDTVTVKIIRLLSKEPYFYSAREVARRLKMDFHTVASILSHGVKSGRFVGTKSPMMLRRGKLVMVYTND